MHLVALSGSLRQASLNTGLLKYLQRELTSEETLELSDLPRQLPLFNPDVQTQGLPLPVATLRAQVAAASALVISTPEYANALPGNLKNVLDWLVGGTEIIAKPVALICVASTGGATTNDQLRGILGMVKADVVATLCLQSAHVGPFLKAPTAIALTQIAEDCRKVLTLLRHAARRAG